MSFKDLSYPKKGMIIGLIIVILFLLISLFLPVRCIGLSEDGTTACSPLQGFDIVIYNFKTLSEYPINILIYLIIPAILIGTIIGWIYGKIKEKRQP